MPRHPQRPRVDGVYRIVHVDNVPDILQRGMFATNHPARPAGYRFIGHRRLTAQRKDYRVPLPGGGDLGDYVPFYFGKHSIMLLNIHTGYGVEKIPREEIVYLLCRLDSLDAAGCEYCFTDGHAKSLQTNFYTDRADLDQVDWSVVNLKHWQNTPEDRDRQRRKQAELLVRDHVPSQCIDFIVTFGEEALTRVEQYVVNSGLKLHCRSKTDGTFYY